MAFVTKVWKDRIAEFAGRRKLTNVDTGDVTTVDVSRDEGEISQAGDAFSAANMNDLETRIGDAIGELSENLQGFTPILDETGKITGYKTTAGADTVFPFSGVIGKALVIAVKQATTGQAYYSCALPYVNTEIATYSGYVVTVKKKGTVRLYGASANDYAERSTSTVYYQLNGGSRVAIGSSNSTYFFGYSYKDVAVNEGDTLTFSMYSSESSGSKHGGIVFGFFISD